MSQTDARPIINMIHQFPITNLDLLAWHVITWHLIPDTWCLTPVLDMLLLNTWYLTPVLDMLSLDTCYLTPDIWHLILDTCYHSLDMLSHGTSTLDLILWQLTRYYYTWHLYYFTYSWLSLLRELGMIIILLPDLWYSCAPELLYSWPL